MVTYVVQATQAAAGWILPKLSSSQDESGTVTPKSTTRAALPRTTSKDTYRNSPIPRDIYPSPNPTFRIPNEVGDQFVPQTKPLEIATAQTQLPNIDVPKSQESLWQKYQDGNLTWSAMMQKGIELELKERARVLQAWNIQERPAGEDYNAIHSKNSEPTVYLDGSNPSKGRGVFSDIDLTANTREAWDKMRKTAQNMGFKTEEDEGFEDSYIFRIPALNAVIWRPRPGGDSVLSGDEEFVKYVRFSATNVESVDPSSLNPTFSLENVIAMANKGQVGFSKPVSEWGTDYTRYETLIQMAKATYLAMIQTGIDKVDKEKSTQRDRLYELCKMKKSPEELGIFKPGASEDEIKAGLQNEQTAIKDLFAESFQLSEKQLTDKVKALKGRIEAHEELHRTRKWNNDKPAKRIEFEALLKDVLDAHNRLAKMEVQLQAQSLSSDHRKILEFLLLPNLPAETSAKKKDELFQTAYLKLESYIDAHKRKFGMFYLKETYAHSPKAQLPDHTDGREEFLEAPEVVPTPPPPEDEAAPNEVQSSEEQAASRMRRRRSSQLTLTPLEDQPRSRHSSYS